MRRHDRRAILARPRRQLAPPRPRGRQTKRFVRLVPMGMATYIYVLYFRCVGLSSASRLNMHKLTGTSRTLRVVAIVAAVFAIGVTVPQTARAQHGGGGGWHG